MKCPYCHYNTFDFLDTCPKCGADWKEYKERFNIVGFKPTELNFLEGLLSGSEEMEEELFWDVEKSIISETPPSGELKEVSSDESISFPAESSETTSETPPELPIGLDEKEESEPKIVFEEIGKAREALEELEELEQSRPDTEAALSESIEPEAQEAELQGKADLDLKDLDLELPTGSLEKGEKAERSERIDEVKESVLDLEEIEPSVLLEEPEPPPLEILEDIDSSEKEEK
ncbi:MAG: hypothetical protein LWW94_05935 [Candidatus Desulfofervidaceae bacterium]|nr:hypothetical protein [Candidatus Desulfofervidaceae bacterium]